MYNCKNCNLETNLFFCPECGRILKYPSFIQDNPDLKNALDTYVLQMIENFHKQKENITSLVDKSSVSKLVFRDYYEHIAYLQDLCRTTSVEKYFNSDGSTFFEKMRAFAEKCLTNECQIAIAGTIKAGKSMFINAILGKNIASTYPTPETASLTKFRSSIKGDYVKVTFYTKSEWEELWNSVMEASQDSKRNDKEDFLSEYNSLNGDELKLRLLNGGTKEFKCQTFKELKEIVDCYTSSRYPEHYFAKEVEVGLSNLNLPQNVVLVDTPGLNDPVSYRTNITRKYLHSANVVLICLRSNSAELTSAELSELSNVFSELRYSKERIYIFGTQIDVQPDMHNYWSEFTLPEYLKYLSNQVYFGSKENALKHIVPVTAWYYNNIQEAKNNVDVWKDKTKRVQLSELVRRCIDVPSREECEEVYGEDADKYYKGTPREVFYKNITLLEDMTYIPKIKDFLKNGPIKDSQKIILSDIKDDFTYLCTQISETCKDVIDLKNNIISSSQSNGIKEQIETLNDKIPILKKQNETLNLNLQKLMNELEKNTKKIIEQEKDK